MNSGIRVHVSTVRTEGSNSVNREGVAAGLKPSTWVNRYLAWIYDDTVNQRYRAQIECLEPDPDAILLDIGCQTGRNTELLRARLGTSHAYGIDYNHRTLGDAAGHGFGVCVANADRPLPFTDNSFSVVTAMDILEHLTDPRMLVQEIFRVLRPGGYTVIATPNLASWHNIYALVRGVQPFSGPNITSMLDGDIAVVKYLHRRGYNLPLEEEVVADLEPELHRHLVVVAYRSLLRLVRGSGFAVQWARGFGYYPFAPPVSRWLSQVNPSHSHHIILKARKLVGS